jgi:hypothetical protein
MISLNLSGFILNKIQLLLEQDWNPACIEDTLKQKPLPELLNLLSTIRKDAIMVMKNFQYELTVKSFKEFAQRNYSDLFRLIDEVKLLQQGESFKSGTENAQAFYQMLTLSLQSVSNYLESIGIRSMGPEELLPEFFRESRQELLRAESLVLQARWKSNAANPALLVILCRFFQTLIEQKDFTQHELDYAEKLMAALKKVLIRQLNASYDAPLIGRLISMNFNSSEFYNFCTEHVKAKIEAESAMKLKLRAINWHYKDLKQLRAEEGIALNLYQRPLKSSLLDFMKAEIRYLEGELEAEHTAVVLSERPAHHVQIPATTVGQGFQLIYIDSNAQELALVVQLMMMQKVLLPGTGGIKEISTFFCNHFRTKSGEKLSAASLTKRLREAHPATCRAVKHALEDMLRILETDLMK